MKIETLTKVLIIFFLCSSISSCAKSKNEKIKTMVEENNSETIVYVEKSCSEFPVFEGKNFGDLYNFIVSDVFVKYRDCYNTSKANQEILKRLKQNEEEKLKGNNYGK